MKLSELVAYKTALSKLNTREAYRSVELELGRVTHLVDSNPIKLGNFNQELENNYRFICNNIDVFEQKLNDLKQQIQTQIEVAEKPWFQESYRLYDEEMRNDSAEYILNRRPILNTTDEDTLKTRIQNYSDWRFPGMIIRPGLETFIQDCSEAYGAEFGSHRISCVKGIMERLILILVNTISIYKCVELSQEICDKILKMTEKKFNMEDLNNLTQKWLEKPDTKKVIKENIEVVFDFIIKGEYCETKEEMIKNYFAKIKRVEHHSI
mgnify:CR=1 FL=1